MSSDKIKVKKSEYIEDPLNLERDLETFLNGDSTEKRIKDPEGDRGTLFEDLLKKESIPKGLTTQKTEKKICTGPVSIEKELEKIKPIENDPNNVLALSIKTGSPLQKYVEDPTENDILYESIDNNEPTITILNNIMKEIAEEAAFLKAWRRENFNLSGDMSEISERRIMMINKLVDTIDKRERIYAKNYQGKIDFYGEGFKKVFESFLIKVEKTFTDVNIPEQFRNIFFAQLAKEMDGFEKSAENIYYGKKKK